MRGQASRVQVDSLDVAVVSDQIVETFDHELWDLLGLYFVEILPVNVQIGLTVLNLLVN